VKNLSNMLEEMNRAENVDEFERLRQALEPEIVKSHDPILLWRLGQIYRKREIWKDAEKLLHEAIKWGPSMPEPYRDLALVYIHRDDTRRDVSLGNARDILEKAVRVEKINNDPSAGTHTLLGRVLESLSEPESAEAELRKALQIDPHYEEAQYNLAMLLDDSRKEEKLKLLQQSIAEDCNYFIALRDLGFELIKAKRLAEADNYLNRALGLDAEDVSLCWYLGQLKWMQEDILSAELHFRKAVSLDPGNSESHRLLGRFYQYHDRIEDANRELFSAIELDPSDEDSILAYLKFLGEFEDRNFATSLFSAAKQNTLLPQQRLAELEGRMFAQ
jgi:Flp pilus assembly protein TadD